MFGCELTTRGIPIGCGIGFCLLGFMGGEILLGKSNCEAQIHVPFNCERSEQQS